MPAVGWKHHSTDKILNLKATCISVFLCSKISLPAVKLSHLGKMRHIPGTLDMHGEAFLFLLWNLWCSKCIWVQTQMSSLECLFAFLSFLSDFPAFGKNRLGCWKMGQDFQLIFCGCWLFSKFFCLCYIPWTSPSCSTLWLLKKFLAAARNAAWSMWDLSSPTRDQTHSPCTGRQSFNHLTTGEAPNTMAF